MNWHIGQDIVCIKTHSRGFATKGTVYTIKSIRSGACNCKDLDLDIGVRYDMGNVDVVTCGVCRCKLANDGVEWMSETIFYPLDTLVNISELTEVLNEPAFK